MNGTAEYSKKRKSSVVVKKENSTVLCALNRRGEQDGNLWHLVSRRRTIDDNIAYIYTVVLSFFESF